MLVFSFSAHMLRQRTSWPCPSSQLACLDLVARYICWSLIHSDSNRWVLLLPWVDFALLVDGLRSHLEDECPWPNRWTTKSLNTPTRPLWRRAPSGCNMYVYFSRHVLCPCESIDTNENPSAEFCLVSTLKDHCQPLGLLSLISRMHCGRRRYIRAL
jgi:hypothetical protein